MVEEEWEGLAKKIESLNWVPSGEIDDTRFEKLLDELKLWCNSECTDRIVTFLKCGILSVLEKSVFHSHQELRVLSIRVLGHLSCLLDLESRDELREKTQFFPNRSILVDALGQSIRLINKILTKYCLALPKEFHPELTIQIRESELMALIFLVKKWIPVIEYRELVIFILYLAFWAVNSGIYKLQLEAIQLLLISTTYGWNWDWMLEYLSCASNYSLLLVNLELFLQVINSSNYEMSDRISYAHGIILDCLYSENTILVERAIIVIKRALKKKMHRLFLPHALCSSSDMNTVVEHFNYCVLALLKGQSKNFLKKTVKFLNVGTSQRDESDDGSCLSTSEKKNCTEKFVSEDSGGEMLLEWRRGWLSLFVSLFNPSYNSNFGHFFESIPATWKQHRVNFLESIVLSLSTEGISDADLLEALTRTVFEIPFSETTTLLHTRWLLAWRDVLPRSGHLIENFIKYVELMVRSQSSPQRLRKAGFEFIEHLVHALASFEGWDIWYIFDTWIEAIKELVSFGVWELKDSCVDHLKVLLGDVPEVITQGWIKKGILDFLSSSLQEEADYYRASVYEMIRCICKSTSVWEKIKLVNLASNGINTPLVAHILSMPGRGEVSRHSHAQLLCEWVTKDHISKDIVSQLQNDDFVHLIESFLLDEGMEVKNQGLYLLGKLMLLDKDGDAWKERGLKWLLDCIDSSLRCVRLTAWEIIVELMSSKSRVSQILANRHLITLELAMAKRDQHKSIEEIYNPDDDIYPLEFTPGNEVDCPF